MFVAWGPNLEMLYNDVYAEILGTLTRTCVRGVPEATAAGATAKMLRHIRRHWKETP
jgi:hypothetical protein